MGMLRYSIQLEDSFQAQLIRGLLAIVRSQCHLWILEAIKWLIYRNSSLRLSQLVDQYDIALVNRQHIHSNSPPNSYRDLCQAKIMIERNEILGTADLLDQATLLVQDEKVDAIIRD